MYARAVAAIVTALLGVAAFLLPGSDARAGDGEPPLVIAHRGAAAYAPENTLASIDKAARMGFSWVENDVQRTKDGELVVIERADDGTFGAWSPDLPGCVATAQSYDECVALMREAVAGHLDVMREHGDPVPRPRAIGALTITAA